MVDIKQAIEIARDAHESFDTNYDSYEETEKAFVFSDSSYCGDGGWFSSFIVWKDSGEVDFAFASFAMDGGLENVIRKGAVADVR